MNLKQLATAVNKVFTGAFGKTPLKTRLDDILAQALQLSRYPDMAKLREEAGDILASTIQLCNECGWTPDEVVAASLKKIEGRLNQYRTLGRKTTVAILGGAFNPITKGHIETAKFILEVSRTFDEVWLMPCFKHMTKELAAPQDRLEMCRLATQKHGCIKTFDYEIKHELAGDSYCFVRRLMDDPLCEQYDFSLAIGMDNALSFHTWVNSEELERMIRFVVIPRQGYDFKPGWFLRPPHIYLHADKPIRQISSTDIRGWVRNAQSANLRENLDKDVLSYIVDKKLYYEV